MARNTYAQNISAILTVADIRDEISMGWDDDDIAIMDDDADFVCDNPF